MRFDYKCEVASGNQNFLTFHLVCRRCLIYIGKIFWQKGLSDLINGSTLNTSQLIDLGVKIQCPKQKF